MFNAEILKYRCLMLKFELLIRSTLMSAFFFQQRGETEAREQDLGPVPGDGGRKTQEMIQQEMIRIPLMRRPCRTVG